MFKVLSFLVAFTTTAYACENIHSKPETYTKIEHNQCGLMTLNVSKKRCQKLDGVFVVTKTEKFCSILPQPKDGK